MRMRKILPILPAMATLMLIFGVAPAQASTTTYKFAVSAEVNQDLVNTYGSVANIRTHIDDQLAFINAHFSGSGIAARYDFYLTSVATYTGSAASELSVPHPGSLLVVYTEDASDAGMGGWFGAYRAIINWWPQATYGGVFSDFGNYGMTHEFGHSRGAVDEYDESVAAADNPVSHAAFSAPPGIMNYPYGTTIWSAYSVGIINASGGRIYQGAPVVDRSFPRMRVVVRSASGAAVSGASVSLYPVAWSSPPSVETTPSMTGTTHAGGRFALPSNPFEPGIADRPWNLLAPNFVVAASKNGHTGYGWLPLTQVGAYYFSHPDSTFTLTIRFSS